MECLEFRRRLAAEPRSRDPDFLAHRDSCRAGCTESWWRAQRLERRIEGVLESIDPPSNLAEKILLAQATATRAEARARLRRRVGMALAASLVIALVAFGYAWNLRETGANSLAAMAIAHMNSEAYSLTMTRPIDDQELQPVFAKLGLSLASAPSRTVFAADCMVGPYRAVHLVLRENGRPVTALYLVGHRIAAARDFVRSGWHGREMPMGDGTLVLLGNGTQGFTAAERAVAEAVLGSARRALTES